MQLPFYACIYICTYDCMYVCNYLCIVLYVRLLRIILLSECISLKQRVLRCDRGKRI